MMGMPVSSRVLARSPPDASYSATWSRTQSEGLGSYSPWSVVMGPMVGPAGYCPTVPRAPLATADVLAFHRTLSNWGRWGDEDQLGALNLITPEVTAAAAATVRSGRTVSCARPLDTRAAADNPNPVAHHMIGTATEGGGADYIALAPHGFATSHLDALCHIFRDGKLYNGYPAETVTAHGATRLGIHHLHAGIVTRGVLLDIPALRGVDALEPGEPVFPEDLEAAEERAALRVRAGDALLVRTGRWRWRARARAVGRRHPGRRPRRLVPALAARGATWRRWAATGCPTSCPPGSRASSCRSTW